MSIRYCIEVSATLALTLETLAQRCTAIDQQRGGATTHGPLIVTDLLTMLAEDCAMTLTRPGSREGANMARVLAGHGYELAAPWSFGSWKMISLPLGVGGCSIRCQPCAFMHAITIKSHTASSPEGCSDCRIQE